MRSADQVLLGNHEEKKWQVILCDILSMPFYTIHQKFVNAANLSACFNKHNFSWLRVDVAFRLTNFINLSEKKCEIESQSNYREKLIFQNKQVIDGRWKKNNFHDFPIFTFVFFFIYRVRKRKEKNSIKERFITFSTRGRLQRL